MFQSQAWKKADVSMTTDVYGDLLGKGDAFRSGDRVEGKCRGY